MLLKIITYVYLFPIKYLTYNIIDSIIAMSLINLREIQMTQAELLNEIIGDPILGPYEGEDYWIDEDGSIQVSDNNVILAATIMRKTNNSGQFTVKLVKIGHRGDSIILGFDTLLDADPVYTTNIGYKRDTVAEVKRTQDDKFCVYINKKRSTRTFVKLSSAKTFLKKLDKELQQEATEPEVFEK